MAEIQMAVADPRGVGGDDDVASQQQLQPAGDADAVDGGDIDLFRSLDRIQHVEEIVKELLEPRLALIKTDITFQVAAGRKAASAAGDDHREAVARFQFSDSPAEFANRRPIDRVQFFRA
jgi:hypothetical protein